jgi:putative tributyrin esterase
MSASRFRTIEVSDPRFEHEALRHVTVKSAALRARGDISLYIPGDAMGAVPVVILLHGVYGSHWSWAFQGGAHRTAERMIRDGEIPPMILAMPSDGLWGDSSGYIGHSGQDVEAWIAEEVPLAVQEVTPLAATNSPRFLAGLSMGGFGALRIGAKHGANFLGVSGHSSITEIEQLRQLTEEDVPSLVQAPEDRTLLAAILANRYHLPAIRFDCGRTDYLIEANRELHARLDEAGIPHGYDEFAGGHEWPYWEEHLADSLRFFASILSR